MTEHTRVCKGMLVNSSGIKTSCNILRQSCALLPSLKWEETKAINKASCKKQIYVRAKINQPLLFAKLSR